MIVVLAIVFIVIDGLTIYRKENNHLDKETISDDSDPHPQYIYGYEIEDDKTGDSKMQREVRDGDVVKGIYSFIEADGFRRIVEYTADSHNGFNAIIRREPPPKDSRIK